MNDKERLQELLTQLGAARASIAAVPDPQTRVALEEAVAVITRVVADQSWMQAGPSRDEALRALVRTQLMLAGVSDRNRQALPAAQPLPAARAIQRGPGVAD
jgi:hypothetical protein